MQRWEVRPLLCGDMAACEQVPFFMNMLMILIVYNSKYICIYIMYIYI